MPVRPPAPRTPVSAALIDRWRERMSAGRQLSISALCRAAGISRTTWYALQDPDHRPIRATVTALAEVLEMDAEPLLRLAGFGTGESPPHTRTREP